MPTPPISPGSWLGLLGGGQLGRMFAMAAQSLGYRVAVLDPQPEAPASSVADLQIVADYEDPEGLERLAGLCAAVTTEFENVPALSLTWLGEHIAVRPGSGSVAIAQDRGLEKQFIASTGLVVTPHALIAAPDDFAHVDASLYPAILKARRLGYDGKGQARVASASAALLAFRELGEVPCVLEKRLDLAFEISVVVARAADGTAAAYPIAENIHRDGILAISTVPSPRVDAALAARAQEAALAIAAQLDYVGVLCVEFFVLQDGRLLVNEIAPRPHNSGHYSIDACASSQFEQQVRVLAGLPLGSTRQHSAAVMLNLMGELWYDPSGARREPDWAGVLSHPGARLHLYGKREARPGRKMGHVTCVAASALQALEEAHAIAARLGIDSW
jgi:5-(carboxyamino)imidazole ribonucleotide synthase